MADKSKVVTKAERFVIKLKKAEVKKEWEQLDDVERKKKEQREQRIEHGDLKGASTEQLLKDMYDNADDEGKRGLREAMASVTQTCSHHICLRMCCVGRREATKRG